MHTSALYHPLYARVRQLREWVRASTWKEKGYIAGVSTFAWSVLLMAVKVPLAVTKPIGVVGLAICAIPFALEVYAWAKEQTDGPVFKTLVGGTAVALSAVAAGRSNDLIALSTGQEAGSFKLAVAFATVVAFVPILATVTTIVGTVAILLFMLVAMLRMTFPSKLCRDRKWVWLGRGMGIAGVVLLAGQVLEADAPEQGHLKTFGAYAAYQLDMQPNPSCSRVPGDRVTRLNEQLVIVARPTHDGIVFVRQACPLEAQFNVLPPPLPSLLR